MAKLKVYRTPIGFHDAYVAASSQKAALTAWGTETNLFAQGSAELVTDPELSREPLASPGMVIKRSRGTVAEQIAALPPDAKRSPAPPQLAPAKPRKARPRPDRMRLDAAEQAIADLQGAQKEERRALDARIAALEKEKAALTKAHAAAMTELQKDRARAEAAFTAAMAKWRR